MSKKINRLNRIDALVDCLKDEFKMIIPLYLEAEESNPDFCPEYIFNFPKDKINQKFIFISYKYLYPGRLYTGRYDHQIEIGRALYTVAKRFVEGDVSHDEKGDFIYDPVYQNSLEFAILLLMIEKGIDPTEGWNHCPISALSEEEYDNGKVLRLKSIIKFIETDW